MTQVTRVGKKATGCEEKVENWREKKIHSDQIAESDQRVVI